MRSSWRLAPLESHSRRARLVMCGDRVDVLAGDNVEQPQVAQQLRHTQQIAALLTQGERLLRASDSRSQVVLIAVQCSQRVEHIGAYNNINATNTANAATIVVSDATSVKVFLPAITW